MSQENLVKCFSCSQCSKMFATRSNLKRHMENPNIHNIPYVRSRDQKRWKGHAKKVVSKEETTERMRKWRAENREKNRQNDLRCRVYRLARQKYGEQDSEEKQSFIRDEIVRRLGRRNNSSKSSKENACAIVKPTSRRHGSGKGGVSKALSSGGRGIMGMSLYSPPSSKLRSTHSSPAGSPTMEDDEEENCGGRSWKTQLPFYNFPLQKIELPSIDSFCPPLVPSTNLRRRTSSSSESSISTADEPMVVLPPVHTILYGQEENKPLPVKYVKNAEILDEFVGVVLEYVKDEAH